MNEAKILNFPDLDPERALLGALAVDPNAYWRIAKVITIQDFFFTRHQTLFSLFAERSRKGEPCDFVLVWQDIVRQNLTDQFGKAAATYIAELIEGVPTCANIVWYAKQVKANSERRQSLNAVTTAKAKLQAGELPGAVAAEVSDQLQKINAPIEHVTTMADASMGAIDDLEKLTRKELLGYDYGLPTLSWITNGAQNGQAIILAALPSLGKSTLCDQWLEAFSVPALLFSLEMPAKKIAARRIQRHLKITRDDLAEGLLQWDDITAEADAIASTDLIIDDKTSKLFDILAVARDAVKSKGIKVIAVDYLQLVDIPKAQNREREIGKASTEFKRLAVELDIPVIILSQLSRASAKEKRRPRLDDLRDSGQLEQDADVVIFIHAETDTEKQKLKVDRELLIRKQREGDTGVISVRFEPWYQFREIERRY